VKIYKLFPALLVGMLTLKAAQAEDNVHFSGALVTEPCTLPVADTDIHVDFGTVIVKYLYQYQRTKSQPFYIHLEDCDPTLMKSVSVTFEGTVDSELKDMLALDPSSSAKGVALGLELEDGTALAINKQSSLQDLMPGQNTLSFKAYLQATPSMISTKQITVGNFESTARFILNYQ